MSRRTEKLQTRPQQSLSGFDNPQPAETKPKPKPKLKSQSKINMRVTRSMSKALGQQTLEYTTIEEPEWPAPPPHAYDYAGAYRKELWRRKPPTLAQLKLLGEQLQQIEDLFTYGPPKPQRLRMSQLAKIEMNNEPFPRVSSASYGQPSRETSKKGSRKVVKKTDSSQMPEGEVVARKKVIEMRDDDNNNNTKCVQKEDSKAKLPYEKPKKKNVGKGESTATFLQPKPKNPTQ